MPRCIAAVGDFYLVVVRAAGGIGRPNYRYLGNNHLFCCAARENIRRSGIRVSLSLSLRMLIATCLAVPLSRLEAGRVQASQLVDKLHHVLVDVVSLWRLHDELTWARGALPARLKHETIVLVEAVAPDALVWPRPQALLLARGGPLHEARRGRIVVQQGELLWANDELVKGDRLQRWLQVSARL